VLTENEAMTMAEVKANLKPPAKEEVDRVTAEWLFGKNAEKIMTPAPTTTTPFPDDIGNLSAAVATG
jgi:hypothetical protein